VVTAASKYFTLTQKKREKTREITSQVDKNAIEMMTHIANCLFGYLSRPVHFLVGVFLISFYS
jgi:hypothetical protein